MFSCPLSFRYVEWHRRSITRLRLRYADLTTLGCFEKAGCVTHELVGTRWTWPAAETDQSRGLVLLSGGDVPLCII